MSDIIHTVRTIDALRKQVSIWRADGLTVSLVPTMGALHRGHLSLVELGRSKTDKVIASIFVNPTQFAVGEDLDSYPRTEIEDCEKLAAIGTDLVFIPNTREMYPDGFSTAVTVGGMTQVLCGGTRPTHFDGVTLIVTKLLLSCLPDIAIFGEKDYQQLMVIKRFTEDLNIPVEILGGAIVREEDGLAMSSRNQYLTPAERQIAPGFARTLRQAIADILDGTPVQQAIAQAEAKLFAMGFDSVDYIEMRAVPSLEPTEDPSQPARLIAAATLGLSRILDNWPVDKTSRPSE
ncbi:MAG: pantoate--beta-alanine ligase [Alphaproteobacteria bacterium]|nr:MAG: pantoate--beta-alanine ligase [Alphaproteobacteria bacterium]